MSDHWFETLEAQLEQQLEAFLGSHPEQQELLEREEMLERDRRLRRLLSQLQQQAEQLRQSLLELAGEITQWQERVRRARAAGAAELARRAEVHLGQLMGHGRDRWQALSELGVEVHRVEQELAALQQRHKRSSVSATPPAAERTPAGTDDLEAAWDAFETRQELEQLRRRGPSGPGT